MRGKNIFNTEVNKWWYFTMDDNLQKTHQRILLSWNQSMAFKFPLNILRCALKFIEIWCKIGKPDRVSMVTFLCEGFTFRIVMLIAKMPAKSCTCLKFIFHVLELCRYQQLLEFFPEKIPCKIFCPLFPYPRYLTFVDRKIHFSFRK